MTARIVRRATAAYAAPSDVDRQQPPPAGHQPAPPTPPTRPRPRRTTPPAATASPPAATRRTPRPRSPTATGTSPSTATRCISSYAPAHRQPAPAASCRAVRRGQASGVPVGPARAAAAPPTTSQPRGTGDARRTPTSAPAASTGQLRRALRDASNPAASGDTHTAAPVTRLPAISQPAGPPPAGPRSPRPGRRTARTARSPRAARRPAACRQVLIRGLPCAPPLLRPDRRQPAVPAGRPRRARSAAVEGRRRDRQRPSSDSPSGWSTPPAGCHPGRDRRPRPTTYHRPRTAAASRSTSAAGAPGGAGSVSRHARRHGRDRRRRPARR